MAAQTRILLVTDKSAQREQLLELLTRLHSYQVDTVAHYDRALQRLEQPLDYFDLVLLDELSVPKSEETLAQSVRFIQTVKKAHPHLELIVFTRGGTEAGVSFMRAGAESYLMLPLNPDELMIRLERAVEYRRLKLAVQKGSGSEEPRRQPYLPDPQLYEEVIEERDWSEHMASQLLALNGVTQLLQTELDLSRLLDLICLLATKLLGTDAAGILLLDDSKQHLVLRGSYQLASGAGDKISSYLAPPIEPLIINDLAAEPYYDNSVAKAEGWLALISVPLRAAGEIIGRLNVYSKDRTTFDESDSRILLMVATQAALAIQNAELFQQTKYRSLALEALYQSSLEITQFRYLPALVDSLLQRVGNLLRVSGCGLYLIDEIAGSLKLAEAWGELGPFVGLTVAMEDTLMASVLQTKKPAVISDYQNSPHKIDQYNRLNFAIVVALPVMWQKRMWGVIGIYDRTKGRTFSSEDITLLSHFSNLTALALENEELGFKDTDKLNRVEQLTQASGEIMGDLGGISLDQRLHIVARYATKILRAEACGISLVKRPGFLTLVAGYGYPENAFEKGLELPICSGSRTGLTGHIAATGTLFNAHGTELANHFAVKSAFSRTASRQCYSLLAIPLKKKLHNEEKLLGLLRVENKKNRNGQISSTTGFNQEDEWILKLFADAVVVALEGIELFQETEAARKRLRAFYQASSALVSSQDPEKVLQDIVEQACVAAGAGGANIILMNQSGQAECLATAGTDREFNINLHIRPDGLSIQIMRALSDLRGLTRKSE